MSRIGWKCPKCGALLERPESPPGGPFSIVKGTVRCTGCNKAVSAADVYTGSELQIIIGAGVQGH